MGSVIRILKDDVINKIAAGEVIENPASVVKELVENSLDAGSKEIIVEIKAGGRQLIRVADDGCGMGPDDALLCVERHATSKITDIDDLNRLATMGFRGEAIASIASISKFTLMTSQKEGEGTLLFVDGGKIRKHSSASLSRGTTVEIKSLFFNVPVRKKFQKSPAHDSSEIYKIVSQMALGNPDVKFQLIRDGQNVISTSLSGGNFLDQLKERINAVLSSDFARAALPVEYENMRGFIGVPSATRHNRLGQHLFINRRPVVSPVISRAVREGYGTTIAPQRFPIFVLHFNLPGFDVDVNVHPQKREVRLRDEESMIHDVRDAVSRSLRKKEVKAPIAAPKFFSCQPAEESAAVVRETAAIYTVPKEVQHPEFEFPLKEGRREGPKVIHTLSGYIVAEERGGLLIIDQRKAHHRILFDKMRGSQKESLSQNLLIPVLIDLTAIEAESLNQHLSFLQSLGFEVRASGPHGAVVDAIPQSFSNKDIPIMIRDILEDLRVYPSPSGDQSRKHLAIVAKRGAVSSDVRLGIAEAQQLVNDLWNSGASEQSPEGQKIWTLLTPETISSMI